MICPRVSGKGCCGCHVWCEASGYSSSAPEYIKGLRGKHSPTRINGALTFVRRVLPPGTSQRTIHSVAAKVLRALPKEPT